MELDVDTGQKTQRHSFTGFHSDTFHYYILGIRHRVPLQKQSLLKIKIFNKRH
jgi:hypothetical protein